MSPVTGVETASMLPLALTSLAIMGSPGPATVSLTAAGAVFGFRRSTGYLVGIILGTSVVLGAVAVGVTAVVLSLPAVRPVLLGISTAYILWLAYHLATAPPLAAGSSEAEPPSLTGGVLLGVANPKAWVAIAAVMASGHPTGGGTLGAVADGGVLEVMIVLINTSWLLAGTSFAAALRVPNRARIVNIMLAALLVGTTAFALLE